MTPAEKQVRALYLNLLDAWNKKDAEMFANLFTSSGSCVGFDGSQNNGREDIRSTLLQIFKDYPTGEYIAVVEEVRLLTPNTALLRAISGMVPRGYKDINPAVNAIQTLVAVESEGTWQIALFQNTPGAFHGRPELQQKMSADLRDALKTSATTH